MKSKPCCPCDEFVHPPTPDIDSGLDSLPRQLAGFPEFRAALLREIAKKTPPLSGWRARGGDDFGVMLLEMWAYVLDVLGFYDERIANESYLRTSQLRSSLRKLTALIGYQPRPALAASVVLAAIAEGRQAVTVPARTGFRSNAFDGNEPQIFETEMATVIHPFANQWTIGPVPEPGIGNEILLQADTAGVSRDQLLLFSWEIPFRVDNVNQPFPKRFFTQHELPADGQPRVILPMEILARVQAFFIGPSLNFRVFDPPPLGTEFSLTRLSTARVIDVRPVEALDGVTYIRVEAAPFPRFDYNLDAAQVKVVSPSLSAGINRFHCNPVVPRSTTTILILDSVYPQLTDSSFVVIGNGPQLHGAEIMESGIENITISDISTSVTRITIFPALPNNLRENKKAAGKLTVHFNMVDVGRLTRPSKVFLTNEDLVGNPPSGGAPLIGPIEPLPKGRRVESLLLRDANQNGVQVTGQVTGQGIGINQNNPAFELPLRTPVQVFGNPLYASRGQSVYNEVLGSGNAALSQQSFTLAQGPLTYLNSPSAPNGRRSTLMIRVNGVEWKEVPGFFGAGPEDDIYIVRQNDKDEATVIFGDGIRGARLPGGTGNVVATYRYGSGSAVPPANAINQLIRPPTGLRQVFSPLAAAGGADADQPKDIRANAPTSALILGRAISLPDFEALAREFGGVINARATWAWDECCQNAVVKIWFISKGGSIRNALRSFLISQSDPEVRLVAEEAIPLTPHLVIDPKIDPRFERDIVEMDVIRTLINPLDGILALENIPIGEPLFRSQLYQRILGVAGVRSVQGMTIDGRPVPIAIAVHEGHYLDIVNSLEVGGLTSAMAGNLEGETQ